MHNENDIKNEFTKNEDLIDQIIHKPVYFSWFITFVGLGLYFISIIFYIFGLTIFLSLTLREIYINWTFASIISGILITMLARFMISNWGVKYLKIDSLSISVKTPFGKSYIILKKEILHIEINYPNPILEKIMLSSPTIVIITYDGIIKIGSYHWKQSQEIIDYFQNLSNQFTDEFALYYHKSKKSIPKYIMRMSQDTPGMIGLTIILIYTFFALWAAFAMLIDPPSHFRTHTLFFRNPYFQNYDLPGFTFETSVQVAPNRHFWFGTDFIGRDVFSRIIFGTTYTFMIAIVGSSISISLILIFGISSAFYGGWWDSVVTRLSDALMTFPPFILLILISTVSIPIRGAIPGGYFLAVFTGMAFVTWPLGARIIRSEVKETLNNEYILAAKQLGCSNIRLLYSHILPKLIPTILIIFSYQFTDIIIGTTLLGFIGFGSESTLTWGSDIAHSDFVDRNFTHWWTVVFPTLAIFFLVLGLTLFSDSIRDTLDPKLQGGIKAVPFKYRQEVGE